MMIKLLTLFFLTSCGPQIELKKNELKNISPASPSKVKEYQKEGVFKKGTQSEVVFQEKTYLVSPYSSKEAQLFMATVPTGSEVPVIFTGGTNGKNIVIETIKRK